MADVVVKETGTARGRGVFAQRRFAAGEVVEVAPVVLCDGRFEQVPAGVRELLFDWGALAGAGVHGHGLALGYGSLYNHANPANLRYAADAEARTLRFVAAREIAPGEELTINYNDAAGASAPDGGYWFDRHAIVELGAK